MEEEKRSLRQADEQFERKKRTVTFLTLGIILYLFADIIGKWFVPAGADIPKLFLAVVWCISILLGFVIFYGNRKCRNRAVKIAAGTVFYLAYLALLLVCRLYSYDNSALTGYKISLSLLPAIGMCLVLFTGKFINWYGATVKRIFHLEKTGFGWFLGAFAILAAVIILLFAGGYRMRGCMGQAGIDLYQLVTEGEINHNTPHADPFRRYDNIFNDINDRHLEAARANGLKESPDEKEVEKSRKLQKIETNRYYAVDELTHSMPYLVPKAARLLEDIGRAFQDSLFNQGYNRNHLITVTSVLRTRDQVRQLQRTNPNSTTNSAHCYATTFDISYLTFQTPDRGTVASQDKMRNILMQAVYDLRNAGRCYVKYEKKQTCLHITVR